MPRTERERRAIDAEISRREKGQRPKLFTGLTLAQLKRRIKQPIED